MIEGHTDKSGSVQINNTISKKRAENVEKYLTKIGLNPSKMWVKSHGEKFATKEYNQQERVVIITAKE